MSLRLTRRACLTLLAGAASISAQQTGDWTCPMDPDYRSNKPGFCPRCGMKLVVSVPDRLEYPFEVSQSPEKLLPGEPATLTFRAIDPKTNQRATSFEIVHEKLIHLFVVSENLEYFAHLHPVLQPDKSFRLDVQFPFGGMYRLLADFYPTGSVPQLAVSTLYVTGQSPPAHLAPALAPCTATNLTASFRMEPEKPLAGLETRLFFTLEPATGLEPYLGAWAHMLIASADLIDLVHLHPFIANGTANVQFNVIFARPGLHRIWTQFQRSGIVNTVEFTVPVASL